jgi:hypothetical protein
MRIKYQFTAIGVSHVEIEGISVEDIQNKFLERKWKATEPTWNDKIDAFVFDDSGQCLGTLQNIFPKGM